MAFCSKCGKKISEEWSFCKECGNPVQENKKAEKVEKEFNNKFKDQVKFNKKWVKYFVIGIIILCLIIGINGDETNQKNDKVYTPYSSIECVGKNYKLVKNDFELLGFTNITEDIIYDLEKDSGDDADIVQAVTINGISDFKANEEHINNAKVVIKYHTFKKKAVPMSSETIKTTNIENIITEFEHAGFTKLNVKEEFDLDPDVNKVEFQNSININGIDSFEKGTEFPMDAEIKITVHRPYEKYTVKIKVDCLSNLIFNKYNVKLEFAGETKIIEHGAEVEFEYRLIPGEYNGKFISVDSNSVKGHFELEVSGDTNAYYKISCRTDDIGVEKVYVENIGAVKENEAMVPESSYGCIYENYKDIEEKFKNAGFTNISTEILYDIYWGVTPEGEVEKVSINGNTDFKRGDIFKKDSKVVITYHMKEESKPNNSSGNNASANNGTNGSEESATKPSNNTGKKINPPKSSSKAYSEYYKDIKKEFENAGFTNIVLEKIEDITPTSVWNKEGEIKSISIDGKSSFKTTDSFNTDSKIVIKYHTYPTYKYTSTTVAKMNKDLENNAANAKEKYKDKYFEISGKVSNIDADLSYITIYSGSNTWDTVMCMINNVSTERIVKTLKKGQSIKVRCQITSVGEVLGYTGYITEIIK